MIMDDYGASWCSVQVFSLCLFCMLTSEAFQGAQPSSLISMMGRAPRFLQIDAVDSARAGPACSREPTESQDFLHLLRGSDLAEDASLQLNFCGFFGTQWDVLKMLK